LVSLRHGWARTAGVTPPNRRRRTGQPSRHAVVVAGKERPASGQAGRASGRTLCQVAHPDRRGRHVPHRCRSCGKGLARAPEVGLERRQVFDIPAIAVAVTEHQLIKRRCGCGTVTTADVLAGVEAPVQYGAPRLRRVRRARRLVSYDTYEEKDHSALARRLLDKHDDHLRFTIDARVPFDNNAAEVRNPDDQGPAEGIRLPAHPHRSRAVLRHPLLSGHHRQTRQRPAGRPHPAHQPAPLAALRRLKHSSRKLQQLTSHLTIL
jgi:zinc-finger binding domain of transposase IS66